MYLALLGEYLSTADEICRLDHIGTTLDLSVCHVKEERLVTEIYLLAAFDSGACRDFIVLNGFGTSKDHNFFASNLENAWI